MITVVRPFKITGIEREGFTRGAYYPVLAIREDILTENRREPSYLLRNNEGEPSWLWEHEFHIVDEWSR